LIRNKQIFKNASKFLPAFWAHYAHLMDQAVRRSFPEYKTGAAKSVILTIRIFAAPAADMAHRTASVSVFTQSRS
jgi:hypothetical protein